VVYDHVFNQEVTSRTGLMEYPPLRTLSPAVAWASTDMWLGCMDSGVPDRDASSVLLMVAAPSVGLEKATRTSKADLAAPDWYWLRSLHHPPRMGPCSRTDIPGERDRCYGPLPPWRSDDDDDVTHNVVLSVS